MDEQSFLSLSDDEIAAHVRAAGASCWALSLGGTRRAYIAERGTLATAGDLEGYFTWVDAAERQVLAQLYALGVETILAVARVSTDRGTAYQQLNVHTLHSLTTSPERSRFYKQLQLRVSAAGDLGAFSDALAAPDLAERFVDLSKQTAKHTGPRLIYLFRGDWVDPATEEATLGYQMGVRLGRPPTRAELVQDYYGADIPQLTVYAGSGRPQLARLRPPFLSGTEDLYWSHASPIHLTRGDWCRLIFDHLFVRRTHSARRYPADAQAQLLAALEEQRGQILGLGKRHALGFWMSR